MRRLIAMNLALVIFALLGRGAQAEPIQLLSIEGGITTNTTVGTASGVGSVFMPEYLPLTLNYSSSQGGSITFTGGAINPDPSAGWSAYTQQQFPVTAQFGFNLGLLAPGSTDTIQGPQLMISGVATGTLTGPGEFGSWRWSGGYSGTATSVGLWPFGSQDVSQLPPPLLDIFNHPDHFQLSVVVTGGDVSDLSVTLTFDPPAPIEAPEPTALFTLVAGSIIVMLGRRRCRAR
jgi:hypothetical protein